MKRTHTCGELTAKEIKKQAELCGWVQSRRDHGGVIFVDLRDRYGLTQVVFDPSHNTEVHKTAEHIGREYVLHVTGKVRPRKEGMVNPKLKTGEIELIADELEILNTAQMLPIEIDDRAEANEETRLKFRYLDLRRPIMQERLLTRHKISQAVREYMSTNSFLEIETPIMVRSTPEGARDYLVPSRVNPGKFYALPQSPQIYKQILMLSGVDRYFQLARCLRDEDLRADRQPEHTQIDLEMSFVSKEDIIEMVTGLFQHIFKKVKNIELKTPFPVLTYEESVEKYGCDKPDLRFGLELIDMTEIVKNSGFDVLSKAEQIKCINPQADIARADLDSYIDFCIKEGAKGMAWMRVTEKGLEGSIVKYFSPELQKKIVEKTKAKKGSVLMFIADKPKKVAEILCKLRLKLGKDLGLIKEDEFKFCWVVDFPLFEWDEESECWTYCHNPFSSPKEEHMKILESNPEKALGEQFDLVLNGVELGSGSIRINKPEIQERIMGIIGISKEEADKRFGFLLEAYKYGAPPHGGMGIGLDRVVALSCGLNDIREVIAFPKNKAAQCPMDGSPSEVSQKQLNELHIKPDAGKKSAPRDN